MLTLNKSFPDLFIIPDKEDGEEEVNKEKPQDAGEIEGSGTNASIFGWLSLIDCVSETTRLNWNEVWKMGVYEFFNYVTYYNEKMRRREEEIKKWKHK